MYTYHLSYKLPTPESYKVPVHERRGSRPPATQKVVRDGEIYGPCSCDTYPQIILIEILRGPCITLLHVLSILFILVILVVFYG